MEIVFIPEYTLLKCRPERFLHSRHPRGGEPLMDVVQKNRLIRS